MVFRAYISLESENGPVKDYQGEVNAGRAPAAARRALESALDAYPGARWSSVVVVLERVGDPEPTDA